MFKSGRWKDQNNKIKVMFQLQLQATRVPKMKGKGVMVALIPADTGKPVAKRGRVPVVDGTCTWEDPVYEMMKFVKHKKSETYKERIYYFNVQTGSSKSGFVGEVGVDFANFAETTEPVHLSLPLTTSNSSAILHVFIQKMQRTDELRVLDGNEARLSESSRSKNQASDCAENGNLNPVNNKGGENLVKPRSSTDWSLGSLSDRIMADELNSPRQYTRASKNEVHMLKSEVSMLERQAELSELELESLRKQILKGNKRSQDLSRKMDELREEMEALETERVEISEELEHEKSLNKELVIKVKDFERKMEGKYTEISHLTENIDSLNAQLEVERKEKEELKIHIEDISLDYKFVLQENDDMSSKSLTTIKEYELQVKRLEEKIMNQAMEISKSLDTSAEFETHIKRLEKELEKQRLDFEDDVQDVMEVKMQAEEALRKSTLTHAATFEKSHQELLLIKGTHKQEVQKLCDQIDQQAERIKKMSLELEACKNHGESNYDLEEFNSLKKESTSWKSLMSDNNVIIRTLKSKLEMLRGDNCELQQRLLIIESEKDNLRKEVSKLEQKHLDLLKESKVACEVTASKHVERRSILESGKSNEGGCSKKELSMHINNYNDQQKLNKLLSEISSLVARNKDMESDLKEMQEKYSEVSLRFAEVESERQQLVMVLRNLRNGKKK